MSSEILDPSDPSSHGNLSPQVLSEALDLAASHWVSSVPCGLHVRIAPRRRARGIEDEDQRLSGDGWNRTLNTSDA
ncbi:hypothetical protein [uncultured Microbacterium sp.]|uniref:hypothetical protein n=1 Tax=uncultured Microbacterium sp. TaxID=191216 RepID=UPI0028D280F3|nr:hypothetical protein [uncultured Microbacterium sp.]